MEEKFEDILKKLSIKNPIFKKVYILSKLRLEMYQYIPEHLIKDIKIKNYLIKEKKLIILCNNNFVMQEIIFREKEILKKIDILFEPNVVKSISVVS